MTTALYRRYRPETFAEVVGQDHVTAPLRQALRTGQTNHAYLFSGPRGCGKTTSARILARCLNCAEGPTDTPCGRCESCVELARGGPGSLDVVEIDAASHGGVDDARDLRERATFAPARDRYKIFILDEAHMVSPQGFNALLKIVEEPPEHVKFIFATTEPDKVIGTIRSRTHHYPFRLVPPDVMLGYLDQLCTAEGVRAGSGVLPLVVRASGGSVRDSLSVLDQLIAGSGPDGLVYEDAVALLGYTHASLLDDLVEAIAARDGASAFRVVERVIATGHEPRRFVEDLLERLRDLIVLAAAGDAAAAVLRDVPGDQMAHMQSQATHLGAAELSRSADLVNAALTEMTGATSPRLHLELLMARLLLPALDDSASGIGARLDRLEREGVRVAGGGGVPAVALPAPARPAAAPAAPAPSVPAPATVAPAPAAVASAPVAVAPPAPAERSVAAVPTTPGEPAPPRGDGTTARGDGTAAPAVSVAERAAATAPDAGARAGAVPVADPGPDATGLGAPVAGAASSPVGAWPDLGSPDPASLDPASPDATWLDPASPDATWPDAAVPSTSTSTPAPGPVDPAAAAPGVRDTPAPDRAAVASATPADRPGAGAGAGAGAAGDTEVLRRRWPEVLDTLGRLKKTTWVLISQNAQVVELDATTLTLGFAAPGLASAFRAGAHADLVQQAVRETLGFSVKVEPVLSGPTSAGATRTHAPGAPGAPGAPERSAAPTAAEAAASWDAPEPRPATSDARGARPGPGGSPGPRPADEPVGDDDPDAAAPVGVPGRGLADVRTPAADGPAAAPAAGVAAASEPVGPSAADLAPVVPVRGRDAAPAPAVPAEPGPPPPWDTHPDDPGAPEPPDDDWAAVPSTGADRVRAAARAATAAGPAAPVVVADAWADDEPSMDDPDLSSSGLSGLPLLTQMLSATVIDEQVDEGY